MACTIRLWDVAFSAVTDPGVTLIAFDHSTKTQTCIRQNTALLNGYGAILPTGLHDIFDVIVDTQGTSYAPPTLETFGETGTSREVDVVLHGLPQVGAFIPPSPVDPRGINAFVDRQGWRDDEKQGVFITVATLRYVKRQPSTSLPHVLDWLNGIVKSVGIDPDIVV